MTYITAADIEARLGTAAYIALTDDEATGSANAARVDEARLGAIGEADSYLAVRYATPIDLSPHAELAALLKSFVLDLAEYRLHGRRPPVPDDIVRRRQEAVTWLSRVAGGAVQLPVTAAVESNRSRGLLAEVSGSQRVFTRDDS